jgi:hypothetical protein
MQLSTNSHQTSPSNNKFTSYSFSLIVSRFSKLTLLKQFFVSFTSDHYNGSIINIVLFLYFFGFLFLVQNMTESNGSFDQYNILFVTQCLTFTTLICFFIAEHCVENKCRSHKKKVHPRIVEFKLMENMSFIIIIPIVGSVGLVLLMVFLLLSCQYHKKHFNDNNSRSKQNCD